jgi:hypothetical protein
VIHSLGEGAHCIMDSTSGGSESPIPDGQGETFHTGGVADPNEGVASLPSFNVVGWNDPAQLDSETEDDQLPDSTLDSSVFDDRWKAQMEELSAFGHEELFLEESSTGYLPDDWALSEGRILSCLQAVGLTDNLLGYEVGDERTILEQVVHQAGIEMSARQFLWHERCPITRVRQQAEKLPLAKRLRGSAQSTAHQMLADSEVQLNGQRAAVTEVDAVDEFSVLSNRIPFKGMRRKTSSTTGTSGATRDQKDAVDKAYWTARVVDLLRVNWKVLCSRLALTWIRTWNRAGGTLGSSMPLTLIWIRTWKLGPCWR